MGQYFFGLTKHRSLMVQLRRQFGTRVWDPPISEVGYVGVGIGAAISGLRPIVDLATASFVFQAFGQVVNELAHVRYASGGQTAAPIVLHMNHGIRGGGAPQHSHSPQAMLWNAPGLRIVLPSTPRDVRGLIRTAVSCEDPVVWIDHVKLFDEVGVVPSEPEFVPFGVAAIRRTGVDLTLVATSRMVSVALAAADILLTKGYSAEVIDPRTLVPFDIDTLLNSVAKTGRLVIVDECHLSCGVSAEIAARVAEHGFGFLRAPIRRVATLDVPVPFSPPLEAYVGPDVGKVVAAAEEVCAVS
jgi:pyruvate dehydrogenase E1 component beta subunit